MIWSLNGTKPLDLFAGHFVEHRLGLVHFPCQIRTSSSIRVVGEHQLSVSIFQLGGSEGFPDGDEKVEDDFNVSQVLKYQHERYQSSRAPRSLKRRPIESQENGAAYSLEAQNLHSFTSIHLILKSALDPLISRSHSHP